MSPQAVATALALPPLLLVVLAFAGGIWALGGRRGGAVLVMLTAIGTLGLATPMAEGLLRQWLEEGGMSPSPAPPPGDTAVASAIIVLGADVAHGDGGAEIGPLTLERLRAAAVLQRATGLPLLVTAGPLSPGDPALATLMAESLQRDFSVPVRWVEAEASDTWGNARLSTAMLRGEGIAAAHLVTHAWHLARARAAFARAGLSVVPAPVRLDRAPDGRLSDWVPRADHLAGSWYMIREWVGRAVYALRAREDG